MSCLFPHTSASLTVNENADLSVRVNSATVFNKIVPENQSDYTHVFEGSDDFPAHLKSSLLGCTLSLPITKGPLT